MPKVTYLLIQSRKGAYGSPIGVGTLQTYGHAFYDAKHDAHVFRFTKEQWEGGVDKEIAENGHRSFGKWIIRAEVEPDLESPEGKRAQEVDALNARIVELEARDAEMEPYRKALAEADARAAGNTLTIQPSEDPPARESGEDPPPGFGTTDRSEMGFDELEALFNKLNAEGAGLTLPAEGKPSKVKYREVLTAYYAKAA